ncbi:bacteriohemerythrin [Thioalkalivibrio sp. ALgr3]|uniref:bacteriohemerythrin n=1 Tax=Thioalkalivibrio sp. ALgr3 TaxID=1239292 RepID=UPI00035DEB28|nr:bacteriohemerythrin [Thioalkalivibrio sp. ALgr3]
MTSLNWSSNLELGLDVIDEQHKRIFEYLQQTEHAIATENEQEVREVVDGLLDYTSSHLVFEEGLMEKAGYPALDAHRKVHEAFAARIEKLRGELEKGHDTFGVARKIRSDLGLWLMNHIKRDDLDYVPYVRPILEGGWLSRWKKKIFGG